MDLRRIQYLIKVAECGSFSKAASVIGVAQPALGRQVHKLEQDCGVQLLYRHGRGAVLTPDGERFVERVRPLLRELQLAAADLHQEREAPTGSVILGMTPTVANLLGLPLLIAARAKYPTLRLNIVSGYSGYIHEWLIDARVDLAIVHDARRSAQLAVETLADARLTLVSSPAQAPRDTAGRGKVEFRRLAGLPLALPSGNHGLRRTLDAAARQAGIGLDVRYEIDTLALMKDLVLAGAAHTVLALPAVRAEVESGRLVARAIHRPALTTRLMLAKAARRPFTRAVRVMERELREVLREVLRDAPMDLGVTPA